MVKGGPNCCNQDIVEQPVNLTTLSARYGERAAEYIFDDVIVARKQRALEVERQATRQASDDSGWGGGSSAGGEGTEESW